MKKQKLSSYVAKYRMTEKDIRKHFSKKEINIDSVTDYCSLCATPLLVVYTLLIKENGLTQFVDKLNFLCDFYDIENDIIKEKTGGINYSWGHNE